MSKKCICKNCGDCKLYISWVMKDDKGNQKVVDKCAILTVAEEIPKFRGSIDGCQTAVNETRNRVLEYADASTDAIRAIPDFVQAVAIRTIEYAKDSK